jgi:hypothetical protein
MFRLHRKRKQYININLTTRRRESFLKKLGVSLLAQLKGKNLYLALLSLVSFISIFVTNTLLGSYIEKLNTEINRLDYQLRLKTVALNRIKQDLKKSDRIFKRLYIPELKEKAFVLWYNDKFGRNIWENVKKFSEIVGQIPNFVGFSVYPNPYISFDKELLISNPEEHKLLYTRIDKNYFLQPYKFSNSLAIILNPFNVDKGFLKNIAKIKDATIKANLLLEYGLLWYGLENLQVEVPSSLVFPVNLVFAEREIYEKTMQKLKDFCNYLLINKKYSKYYYLNNRPNIKIVIDGICIKISY